ncbi:MAG: helix-turn-helix transcriptional regulator [bacterium]|nr:helix-turn-helix transcriptional regulator [bacterium]
MRAIITGIDLRVRTQQSNWLTSCITQSIEVLPIALISVLIVFLTLEISLLLLQVFVLSSRLRSQYVIRFLAVNVGILLLNVNVLVYNLAGYADSRMFEYLFIAGASFFIGAIVYYLNGMVLNRKRRRSMSIVFSILLVVAILSLFAFGSDVLSIFQLTILGTILLGIALLALYSFALFPVIRKRLWIVLGTVVLGYAVTFVIHFSQSMVALMVFMNLCFLFVGIFHHLSLFRRLNISVRGHFVPGSVELREALRGYELSDRQVEIAELFILGYSREKIADVCNIAPGTVRSHLTDIRRTVGARDGNDLIEKFSKKL